MDNPKRARRPAVRLVGGALLVSILVVAALVLTPGGDQPIGEISPQARQSRLETPTATDKQVLFGDLHVHTTYSMDAFFTSLPLLGGQGTHPPADACDFARHCAALDFYSITDHAQELTQEHWAMEKEANRACNAVGDDPEDPDLVVFHGYEWTQIGITPQEHFGHKNVIFRGLGEEDVTPRPITARGGPRDMNPWRDLAAIVPLVGVLDPLHRSDYADFRWMADRILEMPPCPKDVPSKDLPPDCMELAPTPDILFEKLDEWDVEALVIPHGTAWGSYSPPGTSLEKQLGGAYYAPERQSLVEIFSGHGNSEQYHPWREYEVAPDGTRICPEETPEYLPCCRRAAQIMRSRCEELDGEACEQAVERAVALTLEAGVGFDSIFPDSGAAEWLDCGQARSGFKPDYSLRPRGTVQYALALSREEDGEERRFRWGFIGSSDSHSGRAATGFKQDPPKRGRTDMVGPRTAFLGSLLDRRREPEDRSRPEAPTNGVAGILAIERTGSFLYPGGVVAVHAESRSRDGIWEALERRETYATSGPRILLWFDLLAEDGARPMGTSLESATNPRFAVRALGAHRQKPGCPEEVYAALSARRVRELCLDECFHPSDERHPIERIEVVRIRPQREPGEDVTPLIEDPWRTFECEDTGEGCRVEFEDPEFLASGRDAVYYVRALQEPTPALNAANLRTRFDTDGRPVSVDPCGAHAAERPGDDCLAEAAERAWSSPIFIDQKNLD
jgi:hypothetical protein